MFPPCLCRVFWVVVQTVPTEARSIRVTVKGELEIEEVYLGKEKKFVPRILISKLTEKQTQERLAIRAKNEKKKGITYKDRTKQLSSINVYITNTPPSYVTKEQVYPLYSLRWQVEILFVRFVS